MSAVAASSLRGIRVEFVGGSGRDESASLRIFDGLFALGAGSAIPVFAVLHRQVLVVTRPHVVSSRCVLQVIRRCAEDQA